VKNVIAECKLCNECIFFIKNGLGEMLVCPEEALSSAVKGYEKLLEEGVLGNTKYLTIVDLSQSSRKKRFYLLDLENNKLAYEHICCSW
jgi:hypothetical protein